MRLRASHEMAPDGLETATSHSSTWNLEAIYTHEPPALTRWTYLWTSLSRPRGSPLSIVWLPNQTHVLGLLPRLVPHSQATLSCIALFASHFCFAILPLALCIHCHSNTIAPFCCCHVLTKPSSRTPLERESSWYSLCPTYAPFD